LAAFLPYVQVGDLDEDAALHYAQIGANLLIENRTMSPRRRNRPIEIGVPIRRDDDVNDAC